MSHTRHFQNATIPRCYNLASSCHRIIVSSYHRVTIPTCYECEALALKLRVTGAISMSMSIVTVMTPCHQVIVSSCDSCHYNINYHVIMSSCHYVVMSLSHHVIVSSCHCVIMSSCPNPKML